MWNARPQKFVIERKIFHCKMMTACNTPLDRWVIRVPHLSRTRKTERWPARQWSVNSHIKPLILISAANSCRRKKSKLIARFVSTTFFCLLIRNRSLFPFLLLLPQKTRRIATANLAVWCITWNNRKHLRQESLFRFLFGPSELFLPSQFNSGKFFTSFLKCIIVNAALMWIVVLLISYFSGGVRSVGLECSVSCGCYGDSKRNRELWQRSFWMNRRRQHWLQVGYKCWAPQLPHWILQIFLNISPFLPNRRHCWTQLAVSCRSSSSLSVQHNNRLTLLSPRKRNQFLSFRFLLLFNSFFPACSFLLLLAFFPSNVNVTVAVCLSRRSEFVVVWLHAKSKIMKGKQAVISQKGKLLRR